VAEQVAADLELVDLEQIFQVLQQEELLLV
jgi:hypothetical protein